jgi:hypothetical protein
MNKTHHRAKETQGAKMSSPPLNDSPRQDRPRYRASNLPITRSAVRSDYFLPAASRNSITCPLARSRSIPNLSSTRAATPSPSRINPSSKC